MKKRIIFIFLFLVAITSLYIPNLVSAKEQPNDNLNLAKSSFSCVLCDADTGTIIYQKNPTEKRPIASMTKIMTLLVIYDAINLGQLTLDDQVIVSKNASSMGGSQAYLDANSVHKVKDLIKTIIIASANDSCVALAEHICGSVEGFVEKMNKKAKELNLVATNFINCTGLPALNQYSCAIDCAKMFSALTKQKNNYFEYSQIWMEDYLHPSGRTTSLTNTNKLVRFYEGCDGGKTGYTNEAQHCLCATAKRDKTRLIACVLGEPDSKTRFAEVSQMFNYGFANYSSKVLLDKTVPITIEVKQAKVDTIEVLPEENLTYFAPKRFDTQNLTTKTQFTKTVAPILKGEIIGKAYLLQGDKVIGETNLIATQEVKKSTYFDSLNQIIQNW